MNDNWCSGKFKYIEKENEFYKIFLSGIMYLENNPNIDLLLFAERIASSNIDYNEIHGWYRVIIYDKYNSQIFFFGDAAGSQRLFFDDKRFSDSFLAIRAQYANHAEPNYVAIAELFQMSRILDNNTIVCNIKSTNPDCFYTYQMDGIGGVIEHSKGLRKFSEEIKGMELDDVITPLLSEEALTSFCAVVTGGTDSRLVLSNLLYHGLNPMLVLTGHSDNSDVPIAKEIAKAVDLPLKIIDPGEKDEDWLNLSLDFTDGYFDVVLGYRKRSEALYVDKENLAYEFGGYGGECFKNAYWHPFRYGIVRKNDKEYLFKSIFPYTKAGVVSSQKWYGESLKQKQNDVKRHIDKILEIAIQEQGFLAKINRVAFEIERCFSGQVSHGFSSTTCKIDPFMDRSLVASVSQTKPISLVMYRWHRKLIAKYCPKLSNIPTADGFSCTISLLPFIKELGKKEMFYFSRVIARIRKKLGLTYKSVENNYWNADYEHAKKTQTYRNAVDFCLRKGILNTNEIPNSVVGKVLLIGMLFDEKRWK